MPWVHMELCDCLKRLLLANSLLFTFDPPCSALVSLKLDFLPLSAKSILELNPFYFQSCAFVTYRQQLGIDFVLAVGGLLGIALCYHIICIKLNMDLLSK
jgi:hypothetical protein